MIQTVAFIIQSQGFVLLFNKSTENLEPSTFVFGLVLPPTSLKCIKSGCLDTEFNP